MQAWAVRWFVRLSESNAVLCTGGLQLLGVSFQQKLIKPEKVIAEFVENFTSQKNLPDVGQGIIIPNGKIDMQLFQTANNELCISLVGLETKPKIFPKQNRNSNFFSINFYPLAV